MMFAGKEVGLDEAPGIDPGKELLLLGYLQLLAQPAHAPSRFMIELVVHPHHRTEGIGRRLYEKACELAYHCDIARVDVWAYHFKEGSPAGQFAESLGMHPSRRLFHLRRSMLLPLPVVEIPQGFMLRAFRPGLDNAEWLELNRLIFAAHPENGSWTETDLKQRFEQSWFNPQDFLVLEDATGRMAGFHWTKLHAARLSDLYPSPAYLDGPSPGSANPAGFPVFKENLGEVYVVGIHPLFQNSGLGKYLTVAGIAHLKKRGATTCGLYVDSDNLLAVTLYEKLGFQLHHVDVAYSIPLKT
jgi:mycothiol synthase